MPVLPQIPCYFPAYQGIWRRDAFAGDCLHHHRPARGLRGRPHHGRYVRIMTTRVASCSCGQLRADCVGEPVRISVCHCLDCQKRTGSAFSAQARWPDAQVTVSGKSSTWVRTADSGHKATFKFCPNCGSTVAFVIEGWPGVTAIPLGAFADPTFPPPRFSVYEHRKHQWTNVLGEGVEHSAIPAAKRP